MKEYLFILIFLILGESTQYYAAHTTTDALTLVYITALAPAAAPALRSRPVNEVKCIGQEGDWNCCSSTNPCQENQGDCDNNDECAGSLTCGTDNCNKLDSLAHGDSDCCIKPEVKYKVLDNNQGCSGEFEDITLAEECEAVARNKGYDGNLFYDGHFRRLAYGCSVTISDKNIYINHLHGETGNALFKSICRVGGSSSCVCNGKDNFGGVQPCSTFDSKGPYCYVNSGACTDQTMSMINIDFMSNYACTSSQDKNPVWVQQEGMDCYNGHGAVQIGPEPHSNSMSLDICKAACRADSSCEAIVRITADQQNKGKCYLRKNLNLEDCKTETGYTLYYISTAGGSGSCVCNGKDNFGGVQPCSTSDSKGPYCYVNSGACTDQIMAMNNIDFMSNYACTSFRSRSSSKQGSRFRPSSKQALTNDAPDNTTGASEGCKTDYGGTCDFPFEYKGRQYSGCTMDRGYEYYWCTTKSGTFDWCNEGCPLKNYDPELLT